MTRLGAALVAAALLLSAPPAAQAHPTYHFIGGCGYFTVSDGTDGPHTVWTGEVSVEVVAADDLRVPVGAVPISVDCVLVNETAGTEQTVFSVSGPGVAAGAGPLVFEADPDDVVYLCDDVTVGGETHLSCPEATTGDFRTFFDFVEYEVYGWPDAIACRKIGSAAPGVPGVVDVTPAGDVHVAGIWVKDCSSPRPYERAFTPACAALGRAAPGAPPAVDIRPDGDLYVAGEWIVDCS